MLNKYTFLFVFLFVSLQPSSASARQWVVLSHTPQVSIDVDSIKGEGDTRSFWSEVVHSQEKSINSSSYRLYGRKYKSAKSLNFVDCTKNKIGVLRYIHYDIDGNVVEDFDESYLSVPSYLSSVVPESVGETELLYVCGLRTNNGSKYNNSSSRSMRRTGRVTASSSNLSFPRASCGDPFHRSNTYWPVFIDGGNITKIKTNLCKDAFATVRKDTGIKSVQLASFTSYDRALSFAKQIGGTVGQATYYVNGRVVN